MVKTGKASLTEPWLISPIEVWSASPRVRLISTGMDRLLVYLTCGLPLSTVPFAAAGILQLVQHAIKSQHLVA